MSEASLLSTVQTVISGEIRYYIPMYSLKSFLCSYRILCYTTALKELLMTWGDNKDNR